MTRRFHKTSEDAYPTRQLSLTLLLLILTHSAVAQESWRAGVASHNITPHKLMWMAGYASRDRPAEGKLTDLWAKALVLEDPHGQRGVLITLDLIGIDGTLSRTICAALEDRYGVSREQIAICTSHTHTGPVVRRNLSPLHYLIVDSEQQKLIDTYAKQLEQDIVKVVGAAVEGLAPSQLTCGGGTATFAVNRRNNPAPQVPAARVAGELKGPVDHDVPVLAVHNAQDRLTAVEFGYASHATTLSFYHWSGDYTGFAQAELEASNPGCTALFFAGCGADQNPLPRRTVELARHYGRQLATAVDAVLLTARMTPVTGSLKTAYREIDLPLDTLPTRAEIRSDASSSNKYVAARAKMLLSVLEKGPLAKTYPYPVSVWRVGNDLQLVFLGGEVVVDYALRLKVELSGTRTWVAGYANDVMAYIPSRRVLREGGYEGGGAMVYYGLPTVWAPAIENLIVSTVHSMITD